MKSFEKIADLQPLVGERIGTSDWLLIDQQRINQFAGATGDHQWIHVDVERARQGPFGGTIAHGFLTLSLLPAFLATAFEIKETRSGLNYGLDKVRFIAPVPVNSRLRAHFRLMDWTAVNGGGAQVKTEMTVECEGAEKPVCIAESITRLFP
ncbi:MaoC family dehydratase [Paraburkholderia phenoliruptrix]|uniref:MaoC family dehydratase n=1 Tax=Paraburkholderia phenoliruptrix TaxID=252970 RepID=UPI001C6E593A|nr:MaoC family dehydratase [Paraburkholderia phenoliruptrix]MBW9106589.1 MaoC family dehydratase [Paraburkholderia phenoliruptrix]MBW9131731.1 MaoC family dehydratase [Paraburkholderia ginsengiterrae]